MKKSETLLLHLNKKYFDQFLIGEKKEEYREVKQYWIKRLTNQNDDGSVNGNSLYKEFKFVKLKNGYSKNSRCLIFKFKGIEIKEIEHEHFGPGCKLSVFAIKTGALVGISLNR